MKKKILTVMLSVLALLTCAFMLFACGDKSGGNTPPVVEDPPITIDPPSEEEKMYEKFAGRIYCYGGWTFQDEYIVLTSDRIWYDNTGLTGKYEITEESNKVSSWFSYKVYLYIGLTDNKIEYINGGISENRLEFFYSGVSQSFENKKMEIPECPKSLEYELSDDETYYTVTGIGEATGDVVIPLHYRLKPVKEISDMAFKDSRTLTSIKISMYKNNDDQFRSPMKKIGKNAFESCINLTSVEIPASVDNIGEHAFENCINLTIAKINGQSIRSSSRSYYGIAELEEETFSGCTKLHDVYLPVSLTKIGYRAFKDCERVENVYFGGEAKRWANIDFGISDTHASTNMGSDEAYWQNPVSGRGRKLIINDATVTSCELDSVSAGAFFQYDYLTSVTARNVGDYAFYYSGITSLAVDVTVESEIGKSACEECSNLQSVSGSTGYNGVIDIEDSAFANCINLTSVSLNYGVRIIGDYAFAFCEKLTDIEIPDTVLRIGEYAFSGSGLERAEFDSKADWIVRANNEQYVSVCEDPTAAARLLTSRTNGYTAYKWDLSGLVFELSDVGTYYMALINDKSPSHIDIPSSYKGKPVTYIGNARDGYRYDTPATLRSIYIPSSITTIDVNYIFGTLSVIYCEAAQGPSGWTGWFNYNKSGTSVLMKPTIWNCKNNDKDQDGYAYTEIDGVIYRMKDNVAEAIDYAFNADNPKYLVMPQYITYKNQEYALEKINDRCFYYGRDRFELWIDSVVIPNGVTTIGRSAFYYSYISYIEIPSSVVSIGSNALDLLCVGHIKFNGTREQWDAAIKGVTIKDKYTTLVVECND